MQLDVYLSEQASPDDLPNETQDQVLPYFDDVPTSNIDHRAADTFRRVDNDVVVFRHVECIQRLDLFPRSIQDPLIDRIGYAVIDEFGQHQTVLAFIKHLKGIRRERQAAADIGIPGQDRIDVSGELGPLILVDGMCDVGGRTLHLYPPRYTSFRLMTGRRCAVVVIGRITKASDSPRRHAILRWR